MKEEREGSNGPPREMDRPGKIIVTGIPKDDVYTEADLEKEFSVYGRITEAYIVRDRRDPETNKSRGFAFITYENPKDAADAMAAMEGKDLGGDRKIHCEQAVIGHRKSDSLHDGPRGRGRGRGEGRGRGMERGWRGGDRGMRGGRGRGRGMEWDEYRGGPRGGRGFRGGMMRGRGEGMGMRGRGRGDYFEPDMHGDYYDHGPQGPPEMLRGRPGRRTLLPNPGFRGGRGQGPPPHGGPPMMRGGNEYYDEGPDGYYDHGEGRGPYNEGYEEGYEEEEYYDHYPAERMPQRGGPGGGRGARPFRGRGRAPPHEGMGMSREEEYSHRGEEYPARRGMDGGDYGGRGAGPMRRGGPPPSGRGREAHPTDEYLPPKRQMVDDYGYPAEEGPGPDMRRKEAPRRAPAGEYPEEDYEYDSYSRRADYYDSAPRGRGGPGGRGGRTPAPSSRRGPLLGHDPYKEDDSGAGYYQAPPAQSQAGEHYEEDEYSYPRGAQSSGRRYPPAGDDGYGYDGGAAQTSQMHDDGYSQKRNSGAGPGMYDQSYQKDSHETGRRRDDYDNVRQPAMRRPEVDYSSPTDEFSQRGSDMYASYAPRSRAAVESREVEPDPYARKRHLDYEEDRHVADRSEVRRDYQDFHERPANMPSGPSSLKRERYDGFYQSRQEEVYREL